jgi:hypothetical protein
MPTLGHPKHTVPIQFNPQTLKVSFQNKTAGGEQPGGASKQAVGNFSTKLSVELLFDTSAEGTDVRKYTKDISFFIRPDPDSGSAANSERVPPGVQFEWGSFIFRGVMDSIDETLDYFSEEGVPLRATISLSITRQEFELKQRNGAAGGGGQPLEPAELRDSIQALAGRDGKSGDWKLIAAANNIDDPLRLSAGALINVNAGAGISAGASASAGANITGGASAGVNVSGGASVSASALAKASAGAGVSARAAASASASAKASAGAGGSLKVGRR